MNHTRPKVVSRLAVIGTLVLVFGVGCGGGKEYQFHPAHGRVLGKDGKPLAGGRIQMYLPDDPNFLVEGDVQNDGSFTLRTHVVKPEKTAQGAPEGEYRVSITPSIGNAPGPQLSVNEPCTIKAGDNDLTIRFR
jgi:hypothetical protein